MQSNVATSALAGTESPTLNVSGGMRDSPKLTREQISSLGGKAAHAKGTAHEFSSDEAREAGRKGLSLRKRKTDAEKQITWEKYKISPRNRYTTQRKSARERGIGWEFTFETWWAVWDASGKWSQRGRLLGEYVMARHGDVGPYSPSNVSIVTNTENVREARTREAAHPFTTKRRALESYEVGHGKGWRYRPQKSRSKPYEVRCQSKYVGLFATEQEAAAAYTEASERVMADRRKEASS